MSFERLLLLFAMGVLVSVSFQKTLYAQGATTASISGAVRDANGQPLPGATVRAVHEPTSSQYGNVTNVDGRFRLNNMQVGGPYTVTVSFVGYETDTKNGIYLTLGQTLELSFTLTEQATQLEDVEILANRNTIIDGSRNGAETNVSTEEINTSPTASRNLVDFARLTPQAAVTETGDGPAISIAGQNNRFNSIYIDGAVNNDVFGLAGSGTNGGQTGISPISIDAIEQFQIAVSPYDVTLGGFTGGGINAVTRSGTNDFEGSAYYFFRNEQLAGKTPTKDLAEDVERTKLPEFTARTYGFRLGGPIIKDKLFFFVNGELQRDETPQPLSQTYEGNSALQEIDNLVSFLRETYDYDPGGFRNNVREQNGNKFLVKLDWNISQNHKLNLRHSYSFAEEIERSGSGANDINFSNGVEILPNTTNSTALELNSNFGNNFSNKLILGYTRVNDDRGFVGDPFPRVTINDGSNGTITFGNEPFSVGNILKQNVLTLTNNFTWFKGQHMVTFGTHNEYYSFYNLFLRQNFGDYTYDSLSGFINNAGASRYNRTYEIVGTIDDQRGDNASSIAADFEAMQLGFYVQDEFQATPQLQLTGGLRIDIPFFLSDPVSNDNFNSQVSQFEQAGYDLAGARSGQVPSAQFLFSPRLGFNYDVFGDEKLQVRGGLGIFTGRVLFVWPGGSFTNNGVFLSSVGVNNPQIVQGNDTIPLPFQPDPLNQYVAGDVLNASGQPLSATNPSQLDLFAENFKYPQVFRTSLAVDYQLPLGIVASLEGIFTKDMNPIYYQNINVLQPQNNVEATNDNRPVYGNFTADSDGDVSSSLTRVNDDFANILLAKNGNRGYSYSITGQIQKPFNNGLIANLSYTYGHTRVLLDATSSQNSSNWSNVEALDKNNLTLGELGYSDFDLGSRIVGSVSYRKAYAGFMASTLSLFYTGQSSEPFSYLYNRGGNYALHGNDGGGDFTDLLYVPQNQDDINLIAYPNDDGVEVSAEQQWQDLNAFIENDPYLNKRRGDYALRNAARLPFEHVVDLKFLQDFYIKTADGKTNTLQLSIDIFNFTNMLNKNWGRRYDISFNTYNLVDFEGFVDPVAGDFTPQFTYRNSNQNREEIANIDDTGIYSSRWQAQVGIRYIFGNAR